MKVKTKILSAVGFMAAVSFASAQDIDATKVGVSSAGQNIQEYVVDSFERTGGWNSYISPDFGFSTVKFIEGGPAGKNATKKDQLDNAAIEDKIAMGVKVEYLKRGVTSVYILADNPIDVRGISKVVTFWTIGRLYDHRIVLLATNYKGQDLEIPIGRMNFYGWNKMQVAIPPTIDQEDPNYPEKGGLKIVGFRIDLNLMEMNRDFYVYFDDLRVATDILLESYVLPDDIKDTW